MSTPPTSTRVKIQLKARLISSAAVALLLTGIATPAFASPIKNAIATAESQFGGQAFVAERYRAGGRGYVEVEVLSGNRIVEAEYDVRSGQIMDAETYGNKRRVARIAAALERSRLSLADAAQIAEDAIGPGNVREAKLRISRQAERNGKRFVVELRNNEGEFGVVVNSRNGRVLRIRPD